MSQATAQQTVESPVARDGQYSAGLLQQAQLVSDLQESHLCPVRLLMLYFCFHGYDTCRFLVQMQLFDITKTVSYCVIYTVYSSIHIIVLGRVLYMYMFSYTLSTALACRCVDTCTL